MHLCVVPNVVDTLPANAGFTFLCYLIYLFIMAWAVGIDYIDQYGDVNCDMMMYAFKHHDDALECVSKLESIGHITHVYLNECSMDMYHDIHDMCVPPIW